MPISLTFFRPIFVHLHNEFPAWDFSHKIASCSALPKTIIRASSGRIHQEGKGISFHSNGFARPKKLVFMFTHCAGGGLFVGACPQAIIRAAAHGSDVKVKGEENGEWRREVSKETN